MSPVVSSITGWSRFAIRDSADSGSPCDPVEMITTSAGRKLSISRWSIRVLRGTLRIAEIPSHGHVAHHRAPDVDDLAAMGDGCVQDLLNAVHVRGEAGHDDPLSAASEHALEGGTDVSLGCREAGHLGICRVDHEQVDALFPEAGEGAQISDSAVQRQLIHLEVTGVHDQTRGGTDCDGQGIGNGMVHRNELALELAEADLVAILDGALRDIAQLVLAELLSQQRQRQLRPDDRDISALPQQIWHRADMVLMTVGEHQADHIAQTFADGIESRQDQIDAWMIILGEQHSTIDEQQLAVELDRRHVAANIAKTA